jgi:hypothetical protein
MLSGAQVVLKYEPESLLLFANMTVAPNDERRRVINRLIRSLKVAGVWPKMDGLYLFAAHAESAALINWKNPGTFNGTNVSSTAFTADRGFTGDGAADHIATGFNPSTAGGAYAQDDAHLAVWANLELAGTTCEVGCINVNAAILRARLAAGSIEAFVNATAADSTAVASSIGLALATRTSSTAVQIYKNGVSLATPTRSSTALPNANITFLARTGNAQFSSNQLSYGSFGASLSVDQAAAHYAAVLAYLQAVGAA